MRLPEEEISNMRSELDKYGIQMPAFSKIGGILANELSVDEAACKSFYFLSRFVPVGHGVYFIHTHRILFLLLSSLVHAAVFAINEAIDKGQASATMSALTNPNAMLRNTQEDLAQDYHDTLSQAKTRKQDQSSGSVRGRK